MKKITYFLIVFFTLHTTTYAQCDEVYIPDTNFKAALLNHNPAIDTNTDGKISCIEAEAFNGDLFVANKNISNLTGIEAFANITSLNCCLNNITHLDVSQNTNIDVLYCYINQLESLTIGNNSNLVNLKCYTNQLTSLDVSNCPNLDFFNCSENQLTSLDLNNNLKLKYLFADDNALTTLDLSTNSNIKTLYCRDNVMTSLNIANGNNEDITILQTKNNPNLGCIEVDQNFTPPYNWSKDEDVFYSNFCAAGSVVYPEMYIPDANFKAALLNHNPAIDTNTDGKISYAEAEVFNGDLFVANKNISNLTGIEAFANITSLNCSLNNITHLDVSQNTNINVLYCYINQLESLTIGNNSNLVNLKCYTNQLTSLDVSNCPNLGFFDCSENQLTSLDLNNNLNLKSLFADDNALTTLDLSTNSNIEILYCRDNVITSLNIANGNNEDITILQTKNNPNLGCIQVDQNFTPPYYWSKDEDVFYSNFCAAGSEVSPEVYIPDANFKAALLNHNPAIDTNTDGKISYAEASAARRTLNLRGKDISDMTGIEAFTTITNLVASNNNLTYLDLSHNPNILAFKAYYNNALTTINMATGMNANTAYTGMNFNDNPQLTCIQVDPGFTPSESKYWFKDDFTSYSTNCDSNSIASKNSGQLSQDFKTYPNPATDILNIALQYNNTLKKGYVYTLEGRRVLNISEGASTLDVSSLSKGMYLLKLSTTQGNRVNYFVKK